MNKLKHKKALKKRQRSTANIAAKLQSKRDKAMRTAAEGCETYYCDLFGLDENRAYAMRYNNTQRLTRWAMAHNSTLNHAVIEHPYSWHITTFNYWDDGDGIGIDFTDIFKRREHVNNLNDIATKTVHADMDACNQNHTVTAGWIARIKPDNWQPPSKEEQESELYITKMHNHIASIVREAEIERLEQAA